MQKTIKLSNARDLATVKRNYTRGGQAFLASVGNARNAPAPHNVKTSSGGYRNGKRNGTLSRSAIRNMQDVAQVTNEKPLSRSKRRQAKKVEYARLRREIVANGGTPKTYLPPVHNR